LVGVCCFIPLVITLILFVNNLNAQIDFMEKEKIGIEYNKAIRQFIDDAQQHRGMTSGFLNGDASFKDKIIAKETEIEKDIGVMMPVVKMRVRQRQV